jgi:hypothetical protein
MATARQDALSSQSVNKLQANPPAKRVAYGSVFGHVPAEEARLEQNRRQRQADEDRATRVRKGTPSTRGMSIRPSADARANQGQFYDIPEKFGIDAKEMDPGMMMRLAKYAVKHPEHASQMFEDMKARGYQTGIMEPVMESVAGGLRGGVALLNGLSINLYGLPFDDNIPTNQTMKIWPFEEFDPWTTGGRILGAGLTELVAFKGGGQVIAPAIARGIKRYAPNLLRNPAMKVKAGGSTRTKVTPQGTEVETYNNPLQRILSSEEHIGRLGGYLGRNLPIGVIGGAAQAIREDNIDVLLPTFLYWYGIGLVGDRVATQVVGSVQRILKRKKAGSPYSAQDKKDLVEIEQIVDSIEKPGQILQLEPPPGRLVSTREGNFIQEVGDQTREIPGFVRSQADADDFARKIQTDLDDPNYIAGLEELTPADRLEATHIGQVRAEYYKNLDQLPVEDISSKDLLDLPVTSESGFQRMAASEFVEIEHLVRRAEYVDHIPDRQNLHAEGVAARWDSDNDIALINNKLMQQKFDDEAWTKPTVPGVTPLPRDTFKTFPEWEEFVIRHEHLHSRIKLGEGEVRGDLENRINRIALEELKISKAQGATPLAEVLPDDERFFTYLSGAAPGRIEARRIYRETLQKLIGQVGRREVSPVMASHAMEMQVRKMANDVSLFPEIELTESMAGHADRMHMALFKAINSNALDLHSASIVMRQSLAAGESPKKIAEALTSITPAYKSTLGESTEFINETPDEILKHPVFNQTSKDLATPLPSGESPATIAQLNSLQHKIAQLTRADVNLNINATLGRKISRAEADEAISNLSAQLKLQQIKEADSMRDEIKKAASKEMVSEIDGYAAKPGERFSELNPPPAELLDILQHPFSDLKGQAPILYRWLGLGQPGNVHTGLARNPLGHAVTTMVGKEFTDSHVRAYYWREKMYAIVKELDPSGDPQKVPVRLFADIERSIRGQPKANEILVKQLHLLGRALDGKDAKRLLKDNPALMKAYGLARELNDEIADKLGLEQGDRISSYLAHVFTGQGGRVRSRMIDTKMRPSPEARRQLDDLIHGGNVVGRKGIADTNPDNLIEGNIDEPTRLFSHLKPRTVNREGYDFNYLTAMNIYIEGAVEYIKTNRILRQGRDILSLFPEDAYLRKEIPPGGGLKDAKPEPINQNIKRITANYILHATGEVSAWRKEIANAYRNSKGFNYTVDNLVGWLGGGKTHAKILRDAENGKAETIEAAEKILDSYAEAIRQVDSWGGPKDLPSRLGSLKEETLESQLRIRAKYALALEDLRRVMGDPNLAAPFVSQVYRTQMMAKLGFNLSFGLVNLTQMTTNTYPLLGAEYAMRGVISYFIPDQMINGRTSQALLKEMGTGGELVQLEENIGLAGSQGLLAKIQEIGMSPGRVGEEYLRGSTALGTYQKAIDEGASHGEAIVEAQKISKEANFTYDRSGTPRILQLPMLKLLMMFKSYPIHQTSFTLSRVNESYRAVLDKGALAAAMDGDMAPLFRHLLIYMGIAFGAASTLPPVLKEFWEYLELGDTNVREKMKPPAYGIMEQAFFGDEGKYTADELFRYSMGGLISKHASGPLTDSIVPLFVGDVGEALYQFTVPSQLVRSYNLTKDTGSPVPETARGVIDNINLRAHFKPMKIKKRKVSKIERELNRSLKLNMGGP